MSKRAKALQTLYRMNRITIEGLAKAVSDDVITSDEYRVICGEEYA